MGKEDFKDKLLELWDKLKDLAATVWEEVIDRGLDLWDSFKNLEKNIQIAIVGGVSFVVVALLLFLLIYTPTLPLIAVQNTSDLTGEGNWIAIKNNSKKTLTELNVIMDDKYIYYLESIGPEEQVKILNKDFYIKLEGNQFGDPVGEDVVGQKLLIISKKGEAEIPLVEKKGWFGG